MAQVEAQVKFKTMVCGSEWNAYSEKHTACGDILEKILGRQNIEKNEE